MDFENTYIKKIPKTNKYKLITRGWVVGDLEVNIEPNRKVDVTWREDGLQKVFGIAPIPEPFTFEKLRPAHAAAMACGILTTLSRNCKWMDGAKYNGIDGRPGEVLDVIVNNWPNDKLHPVMIKVKEGKDEPHLVPLSVFIRIVNGEHPAVLRKRNADKP